MYHIQDAVIYKYFYYEHAMKTIYPLLVAPIEQQWNSSPGELIFTYIFFRISVKLQFQNT
jgi:hypothetical protein